MKKLFASVICMLLLLTGCQSDNEETQPTVNENQPESSNDVESTNETESSNDTAVPEATTDTNILVAYFSRADNVEQDGIDVAASASINTDDEGYIGNIEYLADDIIEIVGGDKFSITTTDLYPQEYSETTNQARTEQNNDDRPELSSHVENMDQYDIIFIGYPNWWGTIPMPLYTFLEEYDFTNKTIIPFATHEGSGLGSSISDISALVPEANILDGIAIRGSSADEAKSEIEAWIQELSIQ